MLTGLAIGLTVLLWFTLRWSEHRFFVRWRPLGRRVSDVVFAQQTKTSSQTPTSDQLGWRPVDASVFTVAPKFSYSVWCVTPFVTTSLGDPWEQEDGLESFGPGLDRQGFVCNVPALLPPLWRRLVNRYHAKFFISHNMFTSPHFVYQDQEWFTPFGSEGQMQKAVFNLLDEALVISSAVETKAQITVHEENGKLILEVFWQVPSLDNHKALKELRRKNPHWDFKFQGDFLSRWLILGWVPGQHQAG